MSHTACPSMSSVDSAQDEEPEFARIDPERDPAEGVP